MTDATTFKSVTNWMKSISDNANQDIAIILVGNKCDLVAERKVENAEGLAIAQQFNITYFETSAKDGIGIEEAFNFIIEKCIGEIVELRALAQS